MGSTVFDAIFNAEKMDEDEFLFLAAAAGGGTVAIIIA